MSQIESIDVTFDGQLTANQSVEHSLGVIPDGKSWRVRLFGGAATGKGADESARVTLEERADTEAPWVVVRAMGLSQNAADLNVDREFKGDGKRELRITRRNGAGSPKDVTAWINGYEH